MKKFAFPSAVPKIQIGLQHSFLQCKLIMPPSWHFVDALRLKYSSKRH